MPLPSYTDPFDIAWHFTLTEDVPGWAEASTTDPDVLAGLIETPAQRAKVGYLDYPGYVAARRKFGLYQGIFTSLDIKTITFTAARNAVLSRQWTAVSVEPQPVATMLLDISLLHGEEVASLVMNEVAGDVLDQLVTVHSNLTAYIVAVTGNNSERRSERTRWLQRADRLLVYASQLT